MKRFVGIIVCLVVGVFFSPLSLFAAGVSFSPSSFDVNLLQEQQQTILLTIFNYDPSKIAHFALRYEGDLQENTEIYFPTKISIPAGVKEQKVSIKIDPIHLAFDKEYVGKIFVLSTNSSYAASAMELKSEGTANIKVRRFAEPTPEMRSKPFSIQNLSDLAISSFFRERDDQQKWQTFVQVTNQSNQYYRDVRVPYQVYEWSDNKTLIKKRFEVDGVLKPQESKKVLVKNFPDGVGIYTASVEFPSAVQASQITIRPVFAWLFYLASIAAVQIGLFGVLIYVHIRSVKRFSKKSREILPILKRWVWMYVIIASFGFFLYGRPVLMPHANTSGVLPLNAYAYSVAVEKEKTTVRQLNQNTFFDLHGSWKIFEIESKQAIPFLFLFPTNAETRKEYEDQLFVLSDGAIKAYSLKNIPDSVEKIVLNKSNFYVLVKGKASDTGKYSDCLLDIRANGNVCVPITTLDGKATSAEFSLSDSSVLYLYQNALAQPYSLWFDSFLPKMDELKISQDVDHTVLPVVSETKESVTQPRVSYVNVFLQPKRIFLSNPLSRYFVMDDRFWLQQITTREAKQFNLIQKEDGSVTEISSGTKDARLYLLKKGSVITIP